MGIPALTAAVLASGVTGATFAVGICPPIAVRPRRAGVPSCPQQFGRSLSGEDATSPAESSGDSQKGGGCFALVHQQVRSWSQTKYRRNNMDTVRQHGRRISVVAALTLLAGITGLWSGALAAVTQFRIKGGEIYAQGYDSGNVAEVQANESVVGPGKPAGTAFAWGDGWGPTVTFWGGGDISPSSMYVPQTLNGTASADFYIPINSTDGSTSAHYSVAEAASSVAQAESNYRFVDHTNHFIITSHSVGRSGPASGKMAVQLNVGGVFLPPGTPASGSVGYKTGGTVTVQQ
jgi:hypothetical protein